MKIIPTLLMIASLMLPALPALATQKPGMSIEELAVQLATTPEQHAIVADYYRGRAQSVFRRRLTF